MDMKRDLLLFWMMPCGIPVQRLFCCGKSCIGSITTIFPSVDCRLEGVLDSLKKAKEHRKIRIRRDGGRLNMSPEPSQSIDLIWFPRRNLQE
jgi:hypothetical protein